MCKKLTCFVSILLILSVANSASAALVAHWTLDQGSGTTAGDVTGNGNDGTLRGDPKWAVGQIGGALELDGDDYVECGNSGMFNITGQITLAAWVKPDSGFSYPDWSGIIMRGGPNIDTFAFYYNGPNQQLGFKTTGTSPAWMAIAAEGLFDGQWHHVAAVYDGAVKTVYLDGEPIGTMDSTGSIETGDGRLLLGAGRDLSPPTHYLVGLIDDARVYDEALAQVEIQATMEGGGAGYPYALAPSPADGALHTQTWATLTWAPGDFAVSHDVYLGDNFDDVNDGLGDTFIGNQTATMLVAGFPGFPVPGGLVPGTTYYWRIDEVNDADPNSPWKGNVWSLSIPPKTAYSPDPVDGAEFVDPNAIFTWTPGFGAKLHTVYLGDNYDDVSNAAGGMPLGTPSYDPGTLEREKVLYWRVDEFDGVETHKGDIWAFTTPGAVGNPQPANGAADVQINSILSWTAADNASSHELYLGTDADAVKNATTASPEYVSPKALGSESYDPGKLDWDAGYYWRVDEVYSANTVKGLVWSFSTANFISVDDFESYNDIDPPDAASNRIFDKWIDGFGTTTNGALVGKDLPPYAEQGIVHGGAQSLIYRYDNNLKTSEATLTLVYPRDWTEEGVTRLILWFRGAPANAAERMFVAAGGNAVVYHDDPSATQVGKWTAWVIDLQAFADQGVDLANVNTITIGLGTKNVSAAGGAGQMYFDDIRLYR
ncbi:MAG: LamG domain-containing protein [Phycisphaerae bacterium]|nr:LamG domain-containing protein [Phycisphaerae bacterium]